MYKSKLKTSKEIKNRKAAKKYNCNTTLTNGGETLHACSEKLFSRFKKNKKIPDMRKKININ